ncbi:MAG: L-glutamate gamma-semialdehyde dehydrogenase [Candidatus Cloacimonadales bacterium]
MQNVITKLEVPENEPLLDYAPGSKERELLAKELQRLSDLDLEIPIIIGGKEIRTGRMGKCIEPHDHQHVLAQYHKAGASEVKQAIAAANQAKADWAKLPYQMRSAIFNKAAELLSGKYRFLLNAATMLNQSKNVFQAEIDSAAELIDFWRFNTYYMQEIFREQPLHSPVGTRNFMEYRPLEGFVFAVTPFNFTSIAGNLPTAPAIMGNVVLWKPASTAVFSGYFIMKILQEAGLPDGVINFLPGSGSEVGDPVLESADFAGLHFTGSTEVFNHMWKTVGNNLGNYRSYPRIVGETGGKDFIVAHHSADRKALATAIVRGAFEYQGQKCSALSRLYVPREIWTEVKKLVLQDLAEIKLGPPDDFSCFMNAVIDQSSFDNTVSYIQQAKESDNAEIIAGGKYDDSRGYFIEPTIIEAKTSDYQSMQEEIFAPVLTVYVYAEESYEEILQICDQTSPYALTGAVFAQDRYAINLAYDKLRQAAGNFYINDKPTGAVVGQQPFGGARGSGTNDKAGSISNLQRWVSPRAIKETYAPATDFRYPFMS